MHNTFDVQKDGDKFTVISHNFKDISGTGLTEVEALKDMERKITYFKDNDPVSYANNIKNRISNGLSCGCGYKLDDPIFWVHGG